MLNKAIPYIKNIVNSIKREDIYRDYLSGQVYIYRDHIMFILITSMKISLNR